MIARRSTGGFALAAAMLLAAGGTAFAQVRLDGPREAVRLEVRDVPVRDILAALHDKFDLRYRSSDPLDKRKTGVFNGPLNRVTARILDGYDFAMKIIAQDVDVLVLEQRLSRTTRVAAVSGPPLRPPLTAAETRHYEHEHVR